MDGACDTYGGGGKYTQECGGETSGRVTSLAI